MTPGATIAGVYSFRRHHFRELVRFCLAGVLSAVLNFVGVMLLTELAHVHYLKSLAVSSVVVTTIGFAVNRWWTFRIRHGAIEPDYLRYLIVAGVQIVFALWLCARLVDGLQLPYPAAVISVSAALAPLSYLLHRAWSFGLIWLQEGPPA